MRDWPATCRCIKQASSCAVQLPLLYKLCERRIRHCSAVRAMSGSFNGSDVGFKHEQLYSRQDDSAGSTASMAPVSCSAQLKHPLHPGLSFDSLDCQHQHKPFGMGASKRQQAVMPL